MTSSSLLADGAAGAVVFRWSQSTRRQRSLRHLQKWQKNYGPASTVKIMMSASIGSSLSRGAGKRSCCCDPPSRGKYGNIHEHVTTKLAIWPLRAPGCGSPVPDGCFAQSVVVSLSSALAGVVKEDRPRNHTPVCM